MKNGIVDKICRAPTGTVGFGKKFLYGQAVVIHSEALAVDLVFSFHIGTTIFAIVDRKKTGIVEKDHVGRAAIAGTCRYQMRAVEFGRKEIKFAREQAVVRIDCCTVVSIICLCGVSAGVQDKQAQQQV